MRRLTTFELVWLLWTSLVIGVIAGWTARCLYAS